MKALLIHNPSAGMSAEHALVAAAQRALRTAGWQVEASDTRAGGEATALACQAAQANYDAAFAIGGDGTVNEVLNGLVGSNTALGVLPYGTANVWAKEMGLPPGDLARAARLQAGGATACIDVGEALAASAGGAVGPRAFVLWCGVGFDGHITAEIEPQRALKRRLGALLFWIVGVRAAFEFRGARAEIAVDGRKERARVLMALASNAQLYGGLVRISPAARVDDGWLDLAVFRGAGAPATAWHLIRIFLGWHLRAPDVKHYRAQRIVIRARDLPVQVDGEPIGTTPVRITVRPKSLRVLLPPTANRALFSRESSLTSGERE